MSKLTVPTIQELRQQGWKARVTVFRKTSPHSDFYSMKELRESQHGIENIDARGGKVVVELRSPEGVETKGVSICGDNDQFETRIGRTLATARALGITGESEPRFKVGDTVWVSLIRKIQKKEVKGVRSRTQFNEKEAVFETTNYYEISFFDHDYRVEIGEEEVFASKEELIEKISSEADE